MFTSILVPLDGSPFGESALPAAVALAKRSGARLHVVHVHAAGPEGSAGLPGMPGGWAEETERSARAYVDEVVARTSEDLGESVSFGLLQGPVPEAVCEYARSRDIALIVMSTHGRRGLSRMWLGSVAAGIIRDTPAPVLLVRPRKTGARPGATLRIRHILVPLDGSRLSEGIVASAAALGKLTGATLTLLHVVEPVFRLGEAVLVPAAEYDPELNERRTEEANTYLNRLAVRLRGDGLQVETAVRLGEAVNTVLDEAKVKGIDLIALATHGRSGWQRLAFGSVADKIVRTSTLPVMVRRPAEGE